MFNINLDVNTLAAIINSSFDGIYITDGKANTIMVNRAYETITGLSRSEVMNKNMAELLEKHVVSNSGTLMVLSTGGPITLHQEFRSGKKALITSSPVYDKNHNIIMVVTNVRDLSEIYNLKTRVAESTEERQRLSRELAAIKSELMAHDLVAESENTLAVLRLADKVSELDTLIILLGETGVGKEVFAKYIHTKSSRSGQPFIKVNCGAIPENLLESELFGYEKGAFTGADRRGKPGLFEVANKGTIFLDEIGELPMQMQVKLLRVLQEQEITRVGGTKSLPIDVRVIAATNRDLEGMVEEGKFREDLYYRLMVFPLMIPPLRQRVHDIEPLVNHFTASLNHKYGFHKSFSKDSIRIMEEYKWPGNIRELKNIVERAIIISNEDIIPPESLSLLHEKTTSSPSVSLDNVSDLSSKIEEIELQYLNAAYAKFGNVRAAAESLGISPATFVRKRNKILEKK